MAKTESLKKEREAKLQRDTRKFEKLRIRFEQSGAVIEKEKNELKGHVADNCK